MSANDREIAANCKKIRAYVANLIAGRRVRSNSKQQDLLSLLIDNPLYEGKDDMIIDECFSLFLAGIGTLAITTTNLVCYLIQNPEIEKKLRECLSATYGAFKEGSIE